MWGSVALNGRLIKLSFYSTYNLRVWYFSGKVQDVLGREQGPAISLERSPMPMQNPSRKTIMLWVFFFGIMSLSFLLGAAVMVFELPSSGFLRKGFVGAKVWVEGKSDGSSLGPHDFSGPFEKKDIGKIDNPGKTCDGFTLVMFASMTKSSTQAFLLDMRGSVVHKWSAPFSEVWPNPIHVSGPVLDSEVCFFASHLYGNGDLLVVFHGLSETAVGYGLAKLDRNSKVLWRYGAHMHHDVDVAEDGTIFGIKQEPMAPPPKGLGFLPSPCLGDYLVMLSPEGKELKKPIPILEAFRDSPYSLLLSSHTHLRGRSFAKGDVLHTNSVKVLGRELAGKFPMFKAGQVLICVRELDAIAVLDPETASVVWATTGPWCAQHDAQFLDNGHLLIFDNLGFNKGSRVLEYDPKTQSFPWSYSAENLSGFLTTERGMSQRLGNGNTLIVNSQGGQLLEVTRNKEMVWTSSYGDFITSARRFQTGQLHFLEGDKRARP